jgi:hypothetical protein
LNKNRVFWILVKTDRGKSFSQGNYRLENNHSGLWKEGYSWNDLSGKKGKTATEGQGETVNFRTETKSPCPAQIKKFRDIEIRLRRQVPDY